MVAVTLTHHVRMNYLMRCENHGCDWAEEHPTVLEAQEAGEDHKAAHAITHTCRYDEHAGWLFTDDCRGCDFDRPKGLRRGPS